jgi:spore maturation protein CgeB
MTFLCPAGHKKVMHLPFNMCDPDIHRPLAMSANDVEHYGSDIGFIGMGRPDRRKFFEKLTIFNLKLWGKEWDKSKSLCPKFINEPVGMEEKLKIYQAAKINVNIQSELCQVDGISAKIFEIASAGGFFLTERKKDLSLFFKDEADLISFRAIDELKDKIKYFLSHPAERKRISKKLQKRVTADFTYKNKLSEMIALLES